VTRVDFHPWVERGVGCAASFLRQARSENGQGGSGAEKCPALHRRRIVYSEPLVNTEVIVLP
jgi:hypothetical protein